MDQILGTVLSPVPVVWLALLKGIWGWGVWAAKPGLAPWHPQTLVASAQHQSGLPKTPILQDHVEWEQPAGSFEEPIEVPIRQN